MVWSVLEHELEFASSILIVLGYIMGTRQLWPASSHLELRLVEMGCLLGEQLQ